MQNYKNMIFERCFLVYSFRVANNNIFVGFEIIFCPSFPNCATFKTYISDTNNKLINFQS